ncbi:unnamed protein product, partial [marine sediment metagenome]
MFCYRAYNINHNNYQFFPKQFNKNKQNKNIQQHVDVISKNREEEKTLKNLLDLNIDSKIAKSLLNKHGYKKINTYI